MSQGFDSIVPDYDPKHTRRRFLQRDRSKVTEEALGKVLNEDQAKRFRQIMMQSREPGPEGVFRRPLIVASAVGYPGVAAEVKLLTTSRRRNCSPALRHPIRSADSRSGRAAIEKMLGPVFKGDVSPIPRTLVQVSATVRLLGTPNKAAEEALKLSEEQLKTLATARQAYQKAIQEARPVPPDGLNPAQAAEARQKAIAAFDKAVTGLLTDAQKPRLAQLHVQVAAADNLMAALTEAETAKKLELTKEQTETLTALNAEALKLHQLRTTHVPFNADQKLGLQMRDAG